MKKYFVYFLIFFALASCRVFAQDVCSPVGWGAVSAITGGQGATPVVVDNYADLKSRMTSNNPEIIYVQGTITIPSGGRISMEKSNKTVIGLPGARLVSEDISSSNSGILYIKNCSNIIIRNLTFEGPGAHDTDGWDLLCLDRVTHCWVDHCDFQDGLDGNFDIKTQSNYIAVTWCKFHYLKDPIPGGSGGTNDHRFSNLIGSSDDATADEGKLKITFQFCWWGEGCVERMPRVRFGQVHLVNNLFSSSVGKYCTRAGYKADLYVDRNAFINVKNPVTNNSNQQFYCTFENNYTSGTSGSDNQTKIAALGGYAGNATWNPYQTANYSINPIDGSEVQAVVSHGQKGAGPTLTITGNSASDYVVDCESDEPTIILLSSNQSLDQSLLKGERMDSLIFAYGGTATDFNIIYIENEDTVDRPSWLSAERQNKRIVFSGTPDVDVTTRLTIAIQATDGTDFSEVLTAHVLTRVLLQLADPQAFYTADEDSVRIYWNTVQHANGYKLKICDTTSVNPPLYWNFNGLAAQDYTSNFTVNDFLTVKATTEKNVRVSSHTATIEDQAITQRLALNGGGTTAYRSVEVNVNEAGTLTIHCNAANNSRVLAVSDGTTVLTKDSSANTVVCEIPSAGRYHIYSTNSGIDLYLIKFETEGGPACEEISLNANQNNYAIHSDSLNSRNFFIQAVGDSNPYVSSSYVEVEELNQPLPAEVLLSSAAGTDSQYIFTGTEINPVVYTTQGLISFCWLNSDPDSLVVALSENELHITGIPKDSGTFNYRIIALAVGDTTPRTDTVWGFIRADFPPLHAVITPSVAERHVSTGANMQKIVHTYVGEFASLSWSGTADESSAPEGVLVDITSDSITIKGIAEVVGEYNYIIAIAGLYGGDNDTASGLISVTNTLLNAEIHPKQFDTTLFVHQNLIPVSHSYTGRLGAISWTSENEAIEMPSGISVDTSEGGEVWISGTPDNAGTFNYTIVILGLHGGTNDTAKGSIEVIHQPVPASISPKNTDTTLYANTQLNIRYSYVAHFLSFTSTGTLPSGVSIDTSTTGEITISGELSAIGTFSYTIVIEGLYGGTNDTARATIRVVEDPLNTQDRLAAEDYIIYQAGSELIVKGDVQSLELFNASGQCVGKHFHQESVNLSHLKTGLYMLRIRNSDNQYQTHKIIWKN